jgi:hypothetical protein
MLSASGAVRRLSPVERSMKPVHAPVWPSN